MGMTREEAYDDIVEKIALITDTNKSYVKNALINAMGGAKTEVNELPSVTPQLTSELEKNSKLETVSLGAYKQVAWERDIAIEQLHELGYEFGQKIEPTTKNNLGVDCISRADAIHAVSEALKHTFVEYEDIANKVIGKLPLVIPQETKTGHWIMTSYYFTGAYGSIDYVECSCCHKYSLEEGNYCPNCGCHMVEPQKSEVEK